MTQNSLKGRNSFLEEKDLMMMNAEFRMTFYSDSKVLLWDVSDLLSHQMEDILLQLVPTRIQRQL